MGQHTRRRWLAVVILSLMTGACVTYGTHRARPDRGIKFAHKVHEKDVECSICHPMDGAEPGMPDHDVCGACHDIDVDKPTPEACGFCHTKEDYSVTPRAKRLDPDLKFAHSPHAAKEIACTVCHPNPDTQVLPKGSLKPFCMDCHRKSGEAMNQCPVCHTSITRESIPGKYGTRRIPHDAGEMWKKQHGRYSKSDGEFCALCHDKEASCEECHRTTPPDTHTIAWRNRLHGLRSTWDREKCSACHEDDFCVKCHNETEPYSHRRGWGFPINRHCAECHYPVQKSNCGVCHEDAQHEWALPTPHAYGAFPIPCRSCHPGGLPGRAPHITNSSTGCVSCHS